MKTLVVSYAPRNGSYTKHLLDEFVKLSAGKTEVTHLNLVDSPPDLLLEENLNLIMKWNAAQRDFTDKELSILSNHHQIIAQLLDADFIVVASPLYNFSLPATVKAWVDAIVVMDKTFSFTPEDGFKGLCGNKKALAIIVGGFDYTDPDVTAQEFGTPLIKANFDFMGIQSQKVTAFGVDQKRHNIDDILRKAKQELKRVVEAWYTDKAVYSYI